MNNNLEIEYLGECQLARCYYQRTYQVRSPRPISDDQVNALRAAGFLGYGQEFRFSRKVENDIHIVTAISRVDSGD